MRNAQDELITAQIRARLTASPAVRAINVNIETFHGNVYLMGTARSRAGAAARRRDRQRRRAACGASCRSCSVIEHQGPTYAARPVTPDYRGAQAPTEDVLPATRY